MKKSFINPVNVNRLPFVCCLSLIAFSSSFFTLSAQNIAINATGNQADPSAMLDVSSQTAGVLIPRMSTTERNAISSPATGLQVYNTDCNELNFWNGTCWISMGSILAPFPITSNSSTALCAQTTATYSVPPVTGATGYNWSVPAGATLNSGQGTTSINVTLGNYSGQICVVSYDACENSTQTCIDINVSPIPPTPGNITGLASVAPGQTNVSYFIASVSGASIYTWTVPAGATITTGTGTPVITVNFPCNAVPGNVTVTAGSNCGTSTASGQAITITSYLSANAGSAVFGGTTIGGSPAASGGYAPYTYSWSPNSNLSSSSVANPTALCNGSTTTYTLTVTDAGGCTATSSVVVTRNLAASAGSAVFGGVAIGGSPTATGGQTPYAYSWNPNSNLSGSTVSNPTALCSGSTTTYSVTVSDANGCQATSSGVIVTRNLSVSAGSNATICSGNSTSIGPATASGGNSSSYSYLWNPSTNLSNAALANPTATPASTTTYAVTATDANGCTATSSMTLTVPVIGTAGSISGTNSMCQGTNGVSFSVGAISNATGYVWTYSGNGFSIASGSNTNSITANFSNSATSGNLTVYGTNSGCNGTASANYSITVNSSSHGSQTFNYSGSIVTFTVPSCISSLTITANGAQGGSGRSEPGGLGASMQGTFTATPGQVLKILVGQQGGTGTCSPNTDGGGGGGSFVTDNNNNPWIIAGGGGGGDGFGPYAGTGGTTNTCGTAGSGGGGAGGCNGAGGATGYGASGGGLTGNGVASPNYSNVTGGLSFINGGTGGSSPNGAYGGFGGGAGAHGDCAIGGGGGGGYSGGGAPGSNGGGGGGGSYNGGTNPTNVSATWSGNGQVIINY